MAIQIDYGSLEPTVQQAIARLRQADERMRQAEKAVTKAGASGRGRADAAEDYGAAQTERMSALATLQRLRAGGALPPGSDDLIFTGGQR